MDGSYGRDVGNTKRPIRELGENYGGQSRICSTWPLFTVSKNRGRGLHIQNIQETAKINVDIVAAPTAQPRPSLHFFHKKATSIKMLVAAKARSTTVESAIAEPTR